MWMSNYTALLYITFWVSVGVSMPLWILGLELKYLFPLSIVVGLVTGFIYRKKVSSEINDNGGY